MVLSHRKIARALVWLLALTWLGLACAAEELSPQEALAIEFTVKPAEMVSPGDTTMTFVITNLSGEDIQNVYLSSSDGLLSEPLGAIGAGESQTLVRPHTVTQAELDAGFIAYNISHDAGSPGGQKIIHPVQAPIVKGAPRPNVDFTRQLSSLTVAPGGQITVTYRITNTGNVPVSAVRIRDTLGDFTGRAELLGQGESKTFISRVAISAEASSEPVLEYAMPSGEGFSMRLDPATIHLADSGLEAVFSVGQSAFEGDTADAILILTNTGAAAFESLTVTDDVYGGLIAQNVDLPVSQTPVEVHYVYPLRGQTQFRWRITGQSENGEPVDVLTDTMLLEPPSGPRSVALTLEAVPRTPRINRAGRVTFDISVVNDGTVMAEDALVYEISRGNVRRFAVLPTGDPMRCAVSYEVRADSQFIFCLNYTDAEGRQRTLSATPIDVTIGPDGVSPEPLGDEPGELSGESMKVGDSSGLMILLIAAGAALFVLFILLLVTSLKQRRGRRARAAAERQRVREELGRTGSYTPVKQAGKKN